jgi:hypothetical protein
MQALALQLAYDNTIILLYQPLLTVKFPRASRAATLKAPNLPRSLNMASHACREAALRTSRLHSCPAFEQSRSTYAAAFVGIHLFTAGVVLYPLIRDDTSSTKTQENKAGLQRILQMATLLKDTSALASQGHELIQKLISLVFKSEADEFFGNRAHGEGSGEAMSDLNIDEPGQRQQSLDLDDREASDSTNVPIMAGLGNLEWDGLGSASCSGRTDSAPSSMCLLDSRNVSDTNREALVDRTPFEPFDELQYSTFLPSYFAL